MLNLDDRKWDEFSHEEIFVKNYHGKRLNKENREDGMLPMLTASENNQGVSSFINNSTMEKYSNCITVDMFGHAFYHTYECTGDDNIYFFINSNNISEGAKKFIAICMNNNQIKFSYGKQFRQRNADKEKVMLPINDDGKPDYDFMEAYIKEKEQQKRRVYLDYCNEQLQELGSQVDIGKIEDKDCKKFFIDDLFAIDSGKRLESYNMTDGKRPFIGATDSGNGITNYISNENDSLDKNVLGVNYNGNGMVISFYHPYECLFSDDVKRFHLKHHSDNKYILLFLKSAILKQKKKYNYGYKFNANRMRRQIIMVPVDANGHPDYGYMEQYMKNLFIKKYTDYLKYAEK
jgi:hypothetical protein